MAITKLKQHKFVEQYSNWIKDNTGIYQHPNNIIELTTPFLDSHNDALQIYIQDNGSGDLRLSDGGYILSDLEMSGVTLSTKNRDRIMREMISSFGVLLSDQNDLYIFASPDNFAQKKHCLVQAMLAMSDMYILSRGTIKEVFKDDVRNFFDQHEIRYTANIIMKGRSGFEHSIDFVIPRSRTQPERLIQTFNKPTQSTVQSFLFGLNELKEVRKEKFRTYIFSKENVSKTVGNALKEYNSNIITWDNREQFLSELIA